MLKLEIEESKSLIEAKFYLFFSFILSFFSIPFLAQSFPWKPTFLSLENIGTFYGYLFVLLTMFCIVLKYEGVREEKGVRAFGLCFSFSEVSLAYNMMVFSLVIRYLVHLKKVLGEGELIERDFVLISVIVFILLRCFFTKEIVLAVEGELETNSYFDFLIVFFLVDFLNFSVISFFVLLL